MTQTEFDAVRVEGLRPAKGHYVLNGQVVHVSNFALGGLKPATMQGYKTYKRNVTLHIGHDAATSTACVKLNGQMELVELVPSGHWWVR